MVVNRTELQKERHGHSVAKSYRESMNDKVKIVLIDYLNGNPAWTPNDLMAMTKHLINHFGLNNRYLPPDFVRDDDVVDVEQVKEQNDIDTGRTLPVAEISG